jgi:hypothetical protein
MDGFKNGYRGRDLSGTGWGLKFDFIIIHPDMNGLLISLIKISQICGFTSFTNYSESLFVEYYYGKEAGFEYVRGIRKIFKTINQL